MNAWRSILVSPLSAASSAAAAIEVHPVEIAAAGEATQAISDVLAVKSALTGRFAQREFTLDAGVLAWRRRGGGGGGQGSGASRSMFLASSAVCSLVSVRAVCLPESAGEIWSAPACVSHFMCCALCVDFCVGRSIQPATAH